MSIFTNLKHTFYILLILLTLWNIWTIISFHVSTPRLILQNTTTLNINQGPYDQKALEVVNNSPSPSNELIVHTNVDPSSDSDDTNHSRILIQKDGRYVLANVFVHMDIVYFVTDQVNLTIPPLLCSTTDIARAYYPENCKIQILSPQEFSQIHSMDIRPEHILDNAVILQSLNPSNAYHVVWESMIPAISMLLEDGEMPRDSKDAAHYFQHNKWYIIFTDFESLVTPVHVNMWNELLPNVPIIQRGPLYLIRKLIVGTRGRCAHYRHCSNSTFYPEDSAMVFRNLITYTHNLTATPRMYGNSTCRITLVQRTGTRSILNFDDWAAAIQNDHSLGPREVRTVDFGNLSIREQILIADSTDVFVLIHGGALAHVTWLPPGAIVVDINPYMWFERGLINWMRYNLPELHLGHYLIQINHTEGHYFEGHQLPVDCICYDWDCTLHLFAAVRKINLDVPKYVNELWKVVGMWRSQMYEKPLSNLDFVERVDMHEMKVREAEFLKDSEDRIAKGLPKRTSCK